MNSQPGKLYRLQYNGHAIYALGDPHGFRMLARPPFGALETTSKVVSPREVRILAPVEPSKIIAAGLNYRNHAQELSMALPEEPLIFLKPPTAVASPGESIHLPPSSQQVEFEGELAIVIGKTAKDVPEAEAGQYILGYTLANDITARDLQKRDGQWTRAKSFDGFCPLGPCIALEIDPNTFTFTTHLNGELKQTGNLADMIFPIPRLVAFASSVMTLLPGDVILTGTPPGVGPLRTGDRISIESPDIGILENSVI
jgi:2-keto-4-pentenoate hydratase/2-oxohepta-3-ene-1,7-dioic acid hydratase in catechol pathway